MPDDKKDAVTAGDVGKSETPARIDDKKLRFMITSTPHTRSEDTIQGVMMDVLLALAPAAIIAGYYYGIAALIIIGASIGSCVLSEFVFTKIMKKETTIFDLSAVVTGLLLAFNLPASVPVWIPIVGGVFAIVIVKMIFGGLGQNFVNPALAARAFLLASYPAEMTNWSKFPLITDAVTNPTPLAMMKTGFNPSGREMLDAFLGLMGGCIGEVCSAALILGAAYLIIRKVISWRIPVFYIGTVFLLSFILGRGDVASSAVYELLTGGLLLGAFFMATDYTTSPMTHRGHVIYAVGCGLLTYLIRRFSGGYPEGVSYSILLMNLAVPLIDKFVRPRVFGHKRARKTVGKEAVKNA